MREQILRTLQASLPAGTDAILIENPLHQYYLSGFDFTDGYLAVGRDFAHVYVDFRYIEAARNLLGDGPFTVFDKTALSFVRSTLAGNGVKKLGFEDRYLTVSGLQTMKIAFTGMELIPMGDLIEKMRICKDDEEMDAIRQAQRITDEAFSHILNFITPERTETEIALELEFFMRRRGASGVSFPTICISGRKTSLPHGEPSDRVLEKGFLTMDFGCVWHGYCSDMTRTVAVGYIDDEMKRVYDTVLQAQTAALGYIDWGKECFACDRVARDVIDGAGYKGTFGHSLGHGVGLYIHESPRLSPGAKRGEVLENGHVVTCEPGIYLQGRFGVRIEDMVLIHDNAAEDITKSPKELIVL